MTLRKLTFSSLLGFALVCSGAMLAQDIGSKYPAIGEAQRHIHEASQKIDEAEQAHHGLGGHGKKAQELLEQANGELKEAAGYLDHQHH
jgi:hypothetical protein